MFSFLWRLRQMSSLPEGDGVKMQEEKWMVANV